FATLILAFAQSAEAQSKYAALIGGSSRDPREKPFFRQHFETFNQRLTARNWQTTILFSSGDHALPAEPATNANIQKLLDATAATSPPPTHSTKPSSIPHRPIRIRISSTHSTAPGSKTPNPRTSPRSLRSNHTPNRLGTTSRPPPIPPAPVAPSFSTAPTPPKP